MTQLHEQLVTMNDASTFLDFVRALALDRRSDPENRENTSIEGFLELARSWAEDSDFGTKRGLSAASAWKKGATFLCCGKICE